MLGAGTTNANGTLAISGAAPKALARILNSNGAATWTGTGDIFIGGGGTLNIAAGTIFDVQTDRNIVFSGGAPPTINNAGTFQRSAGAGTTIIGMTFNNTGSVDVQSGTLSLDGGGTSTGSFDATGAALTFNGTHTLSAAAAITGGNVTVGGTVNHAGSYSIAGTTTVANGTANLTGPVRAGHRQRPSRLSLRSDRPRPGERPPRRRLDRGRDAAGARESTCRARRGRQG